MSEVVNLISVLIMGASIAVAFFVFARSGFGGLVRKRRRKPAKSVTNPYGLNCRVGIREGSKSFDVEISGVIHAPSDVHSITAEVSIVDMTEGLDKATEVLSAVTKLQSDCSKAFIYEADLGKLPNKVTMLSDWTTVCEVHFDWLKFAKKGKRILELQTSIISSESGEELCNGKCCFDYNNPSFGYLESQESLIHIKTLAVTLAFAVSAADHKLPESQVAFIRNWVRENIDLGADASRLERKLEKALDKTVAFFEHGKEIDLGKVCQELVEVAPAAERYDILEFCLQVARANGVAVTEQVATLQALAEQLEVDTGRFRAMMTKILPIDMYEEEDPEVILGLDSDMSEDETRQHLNNEYRKWNARVTSSNPSVQAQADRMLELIATVRSKCVG